MVKRLIIGLSILAGCIFQGDIVFAAMQVPPVPQNGYVLDQTGTLSSDQTAKLNQKISSYREQTSVQLAVLMVPEITDDYLERYSLSVARTWGVGEKGKNNGALLLIAKNDRKLRIEVGTGLEGDLTDARAGRIIRDRIAPEFRQDNYFEGIDSGIDGMILAIGAANDPRLMASSAPPQSGWSIGEIVEAIIFIGFFGLTWLSSLLARTKSWWAGGVVGGALGGFGALVLTSGNSVVSLIAAVLLAVIGFGFDYTVSKNYRNAKTSGHQPAWWAGGTSIGGGGRSGGSGGFGGGSFGGGGSSGSW